MTTANNEQRGNIYIVATRYIYISAFDTNIFIRVISMAYINQNSLRNRPPEVGTRTLYLYTKTQPETARMDGLQMSVVQIIA